MTEPQRTIPALPPQRNAAERSTRTVTADLSALRAANRAPANVQQESADERPTEAPELPAKKSINVYIRADVLTQARLAFRATRVDEADSNWSHFVEKALVAESQRRAALHNDHQAFAGEDGPLRPGRPISDAF